MKELAEKIRISAWVNEVDEEYIETCFPKAANAALDWIKSIAPKEIDTDFFSSRDALEAHGWNRYRIELFRRIDEERT